MSTSGATPLVALHGLGSSARAFGPMAALLEHPFAVRGIDLPGFGERQSAWTTTAEAVRLASAVVDETVGRDEPWLLVGHSLGGRIATLMIAALRDAGGRLPDGVVLLAPSPPSREPMDAERRQRMLGWAASGSIDADAARSFVDGTVGSPLPDDLDRLAVEDAMASDARAWTAWLDAGSREDWSMEVGQVELPALILSGSEDEDLGTLSQHRIHEHVYPSTRWQQLDGAGHLLMLERPREVAAAIDAFWAHIQDTSREAPDREGAPWT